MDNRTASGSFGRYGIVCVKVVIIICMVMLFVLGWYLLRSFVSKLLLTRDKDTLYSEIMQTGMILCIFNILKFYLLLFLRKKIEIIDMDDSESDEDSSEDSDDDSQLIQDEDDIQDSPNVQNQAIQDQQIQEGEAQDQQIQEGEAQDQQIQEGEAQAQLIQEGEDIGEDPPNQDIQQDEAQRSPNQNRQAEQNIAENQELQVDLDVQKEQIKDVLKEQVARLAEDDQYVSNEQHVDDGFQNIQERQGPSDEGMQERQEVPSDKDIQGRQIGLDDQDLKKHQRSQSAKSLNKRQQSRSEQRMKERHLSQGDEMVNERQIIQGDECINTLHQGTDKYEGDQETLKDQLGKDKYSKPTPSLEKTPSRYALRNRDNIGITQKEDF